MKTEICIAGFSELSPVELQKASGGIHPILIGAAIAALGQIIVDWDNFKNGLLGRPEVPNQFNTGRI